MSANIQTLLQHAVQAQHALADAQAAIVKALGHEGNDEVDDEVCDAIEDFAGNMDSGDVVTAEQVQSLLAAVGRAVGPEALAA